MDLTENIMEEWVKSKLNIERKLSRQDIEKNQLENINKTIKASKNSSFYRGHLKNIGRLKSLDDIKNIPLINEEDIKKYHNKMVCVSQEEISKISTMFTSGTTGARKRIYFTDEDLEKTIDFFHRGLSQFIEPKTKTLILMPSRIENSIGDLVYKGIRRIDGESIKYGLLDDFELVYKKLKGCQYIIGMPMQVLVLGRYLKFKELDFHIEGILLSADNGGEKIFKEIGNTFNCPVYNHYGLTEGGLGGAVECKYHMGMHPRELDLYFEIIDPDTEEVLPDGNYGEIVLTTLTREGMPIIRYRTGDISRFLLGECFCKSPFKRLDNILGRKVDLEKVNLKELDNYMYEFESLIDYKIEFKDEITKVLCRFFPILLPSDREIRKKLYNFGIEGQIDLEIYIDDKFMNIHSGKRKVYF